MSSAVKLQKVASCEAARRKLTSPSEHCRRMFYLGYEGLIGNESDISEERHDSLPDGISFYVTAELFGF